MIKLKPDELQQHLKKSLLSTYIVSGDEALLVEAATSTLTKAAKKQGFSEQIKFDLAPGFSWESFISASQNLSLLASHQLLFLRLNNWKLDTQAKEILATFAERPNPMTKLIIVGPKLEAATQNTKWFKAVLTNGALIQVWPIDGPRFPQWVMQRAKRLKLGLTREQALLIAEKTEGHLLAAEQALTTLSLLPPPLTDHQIESFISTDQQFNVFKLVEYCLAGTAEKVTNIVNTLNNQGVEPILVSWALQNELLTILSLFQSIKEGIPLHEAAKKHRLWDKRLRLIETYMRRSDEKVCKKALLKLARIDKMIKGVDIGRPWMELIDTCLTISGKSVIESN